MHTFSLPAQVVRRAGALSELGARCKPLGQRIRVIGGHHALAACRGPIAASLADAGLTLLDCDWFGGLCSPANIAEQAGRAGAQGAEVLVTVGGGKAMDTGKSVAAACGLPVVTVPTIAATCAAFSTVSARYHADGSFMELEHLAQAPDVVLIDSQVIADAPVRWLAAGMGDTLAKWYEFRAISEHLGPDGPLLATRASSRLCHELIASQGAAAHAAALAHRADGALESVLDAIIIHAGITSIMGAAPAAAAHAIFEGFTALAKTRDLGHGTLVAYGNLCLLLLESRPQAEIREAIELARACGLPHKLKDLAPLAADELLMVAEAACATHDMANMPFPVSPDDVLRVMHSLEAL
jgi:glycerol dehydrogenase-like iron-containing ADH family enzyme